MVLFLISLGTFQDFIFFKLNCMEVNSPTGDELGLISLMSCSLNTGVGNVIY